MGFLCSDHRQVGARAISRHQTLAAMEDATMKIKAIAIALIWLGLSTLGGLMPLEWAHGQSVAASDADIIVKLSRIEETFNLIDGFAQRAQPSGSAPTMPTAMLRGMLMGTDWIDPQRPIVIGIRMTEPQPQMSAYIPFRSPNQNFQSAYQATVRDNYYLMTLPPGQGGAIAPALESTLVKAAAIAPEGRLDLQIDVADLLRNNRDQIDQALKQWEAQINAQGLDSTTEGKSAINTTDMRQAMADLLVLLEQVQNLGMNLDFNDSDFTLTNLVKAKAQTPLAQTLVAGGDTTQLDTYKPSAPIVFRSRSFEFGQLFKVMVAPMQKIYRQMGIDFEALAAIAELFSGEAAGGISYQKDTARFEFIAVLKEEDKDQNFAEKIYLPWQIKYHQDLNAFLAQESGQKFDGFVKRTPDTTVAGRKVVGLRARTQLAPTQSTGGDQISITQEYALRMTTSNNLFLAAPDDKRLAEMLKIVKDFSILPSKGPIVTGTVDLDAYLAFILSMFPSGAQIPTPPQLSPLNFTMDAQDGTARASMKLKTDDLHKFVTYLMAAGEEIAATVSPGTQPQAAMQPQPTPPPPAQPVPAPQVASVAAISPAPIVKDAAFYFDQGSLCAAYGNNKGAVRHLLKAVKMAPQNPQAWFQLGIAWGELGAFDQALTAINRALKRNPRNGLYHYGRGRVLLLAGEKTKALGDFFTAAELGNRDAQNYLMHVIGYSKEEVLPAP
jgi:tetratricopeptide (TPR) repeat protein